MGLKLYLIRKIKALFIKFKLHIIFEPLNGILLNLAYLSKLSKWKKNLTKSSFDDFYSKKFNYDKRYDLYKYIFDKEQLNEDIDYLEFGVSEGYSLKWWLKNNTNANSKFYGFDTFTGLPEDWFIFKQGKMSTSGKTPPTDDRRVEYKKGLFQNTLPKFLKEFKSHRKTVIHLDADLFSSTYYVLTSIAPILKKGDIIFFDEFGVPTHEFKAFTEFINSYYLKYDFLGAVNNYLQISIKIS
jgi:O-methyltransferase